MRLRLIFALMISSMLLPLAASGVDLEMVTVTLPGNSCESPSYCYGDVPHLFAISKYEVTNGQYAEFLNAVAAADTFDLYATPMGDDGSISRAGIDGAYTYIAVASRKDMPVVYVSVFDALRYSNWLNNGQPTGAQDVSTTEDGAYTLTGATQAGPRNAEAQVFLPSENEWYKAAYYTGGAYSGTPNINGSVSCAAPSSTSTNGANCSPGGPGGLVKVGSYRYVWSNWGTFDQAGNAWEWNETSSSPGFYVVRGGGWDGASVGSGSRIDLASISELNNTGFRVAATTQALPAGGPAASFAMAIVLGFAGWWRATQ